MSYSLDKVILAAKESSIVALLLCLCTVSTFTNCFSEQHADLRLDRDTILGNVQLHLAKQQRSRWHAWTQWPQSVVRNIFHCVAILFLVACGIVVWYSIYLISSYGVVIFSCSLNVHMPLVQFSNTAMQGHVVCLPALAFSMHLCLGTQPCWKVARRGLAPSHVERGLEGGWHLATIEKGDRKCWRDCACAGTMYWTSVCMQRPSKDEGQTMHGM